MSDSQWPRYQVFEQRREGAPHENAGSLHAPDNEIALQMARDIFVRRPTCIDLWVAPAAMIFARSAEQLADPAWREGAPQDSTPGAYRVFAKTRHAGTHQFLGTVEAEGTLSALEQALETFSDTAALVWWIVPDSAFTETDPDDAESLFAPANDKVYRDQADYHTVSLMRNIRHAQAERSSEE
jgi:ring-1,2-phenylacetyl-CoA epoxidase subunit PaaB